MPDCLQVFVRFEGFVPSGHVVMPEEDRTFSLFGYAILAARLLARSSAKEFGVLPPLRTFRAFLNFD